MSSSMLVEVKVLDRGSAATATAAIGASVVAVEDVTQFDDTGRLDICGVQYDYTSVDRTALTITLTTPLTVAVDISDPVSVVAGDAVARNYSAIIDMGEGDSVTVPIPLELRPLLVEGLYDPPVPITISPDLLSIVDVPGRVPTIQNTTIKTSASGPRLEIAGGTNPLVTTTISGFSADPLELSPARIRTVLLTAGTVRETQILSGVSTAPNPGGRGSEIAVGADDSAGSYIALTADSLNINLGAMAATLFLQGITFGTASVTILAGGVAATTGNISHGLFATPKYVGVIPNAATSLYYGYLAGGLTSSTMNLGARLVAGTVGANTVVPLLWFAIC